MKFYRGEWKGEMFYEITFKSGRQLMLSIEELADMMENFEEFKKKRLAEKKEEESCDTAVAIKLSQQMLRELKAVLGLEE